jgi:hypothetical protein
MIDEAVQHHESAGGAMPEAASRAALDQLVADRLEWSSRFAAAVSHDLSNIVLASKLRDEPSSGETEQLRKCREQTRELREHFGHVLRSLEPWRRLHASDVQPRAIGSWWQEQGRFIRQFLPEGVRLTFADSTPDVVIDSSVLNSVLAGAFIALSAQVEALERVALEIDGDPAAGVRIAITPSPALAILVSPLHTNEFIMPSMVNQLLQRHGGEYSIESDGRIELRMTAMASTDET